MIVYWYGEIKRGSYIVDWLCFRLKITSYYNSIWPSLSVIYVVFSVWYLIQHNIDLCKFDVDSRYDIVCIKLTWTMSSLTCNVKFCYNFIYLTFSLWIMRWVYKSTHECGHFLPVGFVVFRSDCIFTCISFCIVTSRHWICDGFSFSTISNRRLENNTYPCLWVAIKSSVEYENVQCET